MCWISIHAPRGGSDVSAVSPSGIVIYFNPRSPWGERQCFSQFVILFHRFQSTLPVGGATDDSYFEQEAMEFQSTLPVGGATRAVFASASVHKISIHAPRGGSDILAVAALREQEISIHAPRGGSDVSWNIILQDQQKFQSTLPVGGATAGQAAKAMTKKYFNPRSPWGERL